MDVWETILFSCQGQLISLIRCTGGYSAMVDASKFFYQFPTTHPDDRPYLGLLHPVTKEIYACLGLLPMGAANTPSSAG